MKSEIVMYCAQDVALESRWLQGYIVARICACQMGYYLEFHNTAKAYRWCPAVRCGKCYPTGTERVLGPDQG
jgi:hypothetical protein